MAVAADIHFHNVAFFRRTRLERSTAGADYSYFVIFGMYISFHVFHLVVVIFQMLSNYNAFFMARQLFLREFVKNSCKFPKNALYLFYYVFRGLTHANKT